jgi:hypothetical protein
MKDNSNSNFSFWQNFASKKMLVQIILESIMYSQHVDHTSLEIVGGYEK